MGKGGSKPAQRNLAVGHDEDRGGPAVGWAYLVSVIDC